MTEGRTLTHARDASLDAVPPGVDVPTLADLHARFLHGLGELDRLGEHVGAAYVAAAIDVIETRLATAGRFVGARHDGRLDSFARAFADRFGARAEDVAHAQLARSQGRAEAVWASILARLASR